MFIFIDFLIWCIVKLFKLISSIKEQETQITSPIKQNQEIKEEKLQIEVQNKQQFEGLNQQIKEQETKRSQDKLLIEQKYTTQLEKLNKQIQEQDEEKLKIEVQNKQQFEGLNQQIKEQETKRSQDKLLIEQKYTTQLEKLNKQIQEQDEEKLKIEVQNKQQFEGLNQQIKEQETQIASLIKQNQEIKEEKLKIEVQNIQEFEGLNQQIKEQETQIASLIKQNQEMKEEKLQIEFQTKVQFQELNQQIKEQETKRSQDKLLIEQEYTTQLEKLNKQIQEQEEYINNLINENKQIILILNQHINLPNFQNLILKNQKLSEIQESWEFQQCQESNDFSLITPLNLLITIIGKPQAGKNFISNLLLNSNIVPNKDCQDIQQQYYKENKNSIIKAFFEPQSQNCYVSLTFDQPDQQQQNMDYSALQSFWFNCLTKKSNVIIYVMDAFTQFEVNIIHKLIEICKSKTLILIYNMKFSSETEIELFASQVLSKIFSIQKKSTAEYFISNYQIYHLFSVIQKPTNALTKQNINLSFQLKNLVNKVVIAQQQTITLFSIINDYFLEHSDSYFKNYEGGNLQAIDSLSLRLSESIQLKLQKKCFSLIPLENSNQIEYIIKAKEQYCYVISKIKKQVQLFVVFLENKVEIKSCNLMMQFDPAIACVVFCQDDSQDEITIEIPIREFPNLTNENTRVIKYNFGFEAYFQII